MACFAVALGVIVLCGFISLPAAKDTCDLYAAVGESLTLPFVYNGLTNSHVLRWTHNKKIIYYREKGKVSVGNSLVISATGTPLLKNLQSSSAGTYQVTVLHSNGTVANTWTGHLCILDKVSKPQLTYTCDSSAVNLNCYVANPQGLVFTWTLDGNDLTSETKQKLSISLAQLLGQRSFTCSVANKVSKEKSDVVRPTCKSPTLLCFPSKTVVAVVAGGAGLILLLLIIIVALCCRHRCNKTSVKDKGGLRMLSLSKREPDSTSRVYETMHPSEDCYETVSQSEAQTENKPSELTTAAEGVQPSPVPKPRTKSPQTPNV
ncbi:T-cell surface antigen CD2 [Nibea albiflora]|uniref:T-cell surface antigen CD2 n=1 Tax=Nibea albiflora TaxID=240163 RepID=A0ACB7FEF9_NIBAL|nr:T-cell surface antigen CD2 [Nibea albiflora]